MRYYLDTNILIFMLSGNKDDINVDVLHILEDYANILFTSSIAITELVFLYKSEKLRFLAFKNEKEMLKYLTESLNIEIVYFNKRHFNDYTSLQIAKDHKDMNDHAIISQAIADKTALISSDRKFDFYKKQGLNFIYNKR
ncbi:hypothetical protein FACS189455_3790 [Bacteroidia bacterium]|nr:hypothetical protein FACS189455_3790 [Bacteroidia bacterium]